MAVCLCGMMMVVGVVLIPTTLAAYPTTRAPPPPSPPPAPCVVEHSTGDHYFWPGTVKVVIDSTNGTCEYFTCEGQYQRIPDKDLSKSVNCGPSCVDTSSTQSCKCLDDCNDQDDLCDPQPCQNGGTCNIANGGYTCSCPTGFDGPVCQNDRCADYCLNGGTCIPDSTRPTDVRCSCAPGYVGARCQTPICERDPPPCYNGGYCSMDSNKTLGYKCFCLQGFSGTHCQEEGCQNSHQSCSYWAGLTPSECDVNPHWMHHNCQLSCGKCGQCLDTHHYCNFWATRQPSECQQNPLWMLLNCPLSCDTCADVNPCWADQTPCQNGGTCVHLSTFDHGQYSCICPPGVQGQNCTE